MTVVILGACVRSRYHGHLKSKNPYSLAINFCVSLPALHVKWLESLSVAARSIVQQGISS